jgi:tryptophanyl-tRNA synthetase
MQVKYQLKNPTPITQVLLNALKRKLQIMESYPGSKKMNPLKCIFVKFKFSDVILEKCKKAVTDLIGQVTFDPDARPGVSNLISIHSSLTGIAWQPNHNL